MCVPGTAVTKHLANLYAEGELNKEATCAKIAHVQTEGLRTVNRQIEFYNPDAIISVGYRVSSTQATQFRIRATKTLKEFITKCFLAVGFGDSAAAGLKIKLSNSLFFITSADYPGMANLVFKDVTATLTTTKGSSSNPAAYSIQQMTVSGNAKQTITVITLSAGIMIQL